MDSLYNSLNDVQAETSVLFTLIVSICAVMGVIVAILMLKTTRKYTAVTELLFISSQRPYIGTNTYLHNLHSDDSKLLLTVKLQNYGNVPAKKVDILIEVIIDNKILPVKNTKTENQIFFPHWIHTVDVIIDDRNLFLAIKSGKSILELRTYIKYFGVTDKEYSTDEVSVYNKEAQLFQKKTGEWI